MTRRRISIASVVAGLLVLVAGVSIGAASIIGYNWYRAERWQELRGRHRMLTEHSAIALALPLWNFDRDQLRQYLRSVMQDRSVEAITVRQSPSGKLVQAFTRDPAWAVVETDRDPQLAGRLLLEAGIHTSDQEIGSVRIQVTSTFIEAELARVRLVIFGAIAVMVAGLVSTVYLVLWQVVLRPLRRLESYALAARRDGAQPLVPGPMQGEIETLRQSLAGMVDQLALRITELRNQAELLRASEEKFRTLYESANDAILLMNEQGILACNPKAESMLGRMQAELVGQSPMELSPPRQPDGRDSLQKGRDLIVAAMNGTPQRFDWVHLRPDGTAFEVEVCLNCYEQSGERCLQAVLRDVTALRAATKEAERERGFFEALFQGLPGNAFLLDDQGRFIRSNQRRIDFHGPARAMLPIQDVSQLLQPAEHQKLIRAFRETLEKGESSVEFVMPDSQGHEAPYLARARKLTLDGKNYVVGMSIDLSERVRAEAERQELQRQLIQAQKMEAVGQLAGGVAHDFNNILTAIIIQLNLLNQELDLPPQIRTGLKDLEGEAKRAANLTRQLLMFSRRQVLQSRLLELSALLGNLLKMLRRLIGEHIQLEFSSAGECWVEADAGMLEQVVVNLAVNARDAMPDGGRLELSTRIVEGDFAAAHRNPDARQGRFVCLAVSDTGCGMDEATVNRMFEPFFTTKEPGKGTGLGLATVYGIVKQHQGWIEVQTAPGSGSRFEVFLPAVARPATNGGATSTPETVRGGNESVLLVEDEVAVRRITEVCLRRLGYQVYPAANGPAALELWQTRSGAFDLVLTDMLMPGGMSGFDLIRRLREQRPTLKAIVMTGYSTQSAQQGIPAGHELRFVAKPFEVAGLAAAIRGCLDAGGSNAQSPG